MRQVPSGSYKPAEQEDKQWVTSHASFSSRAVARRVSHLLCAKDRISGSPREHRARSPQGPAVTHLSTGGGDNSFCIPLSPLRKDVSKDFLRQE